MSEHERFLAQYGTPQHKDKLVDSPDVYTRMAMSKHGDEKHLDKLLSDKSPSVRASVAVHGNNAQREKLINDYDDSVRSKIAQHGSLKLKLKLANDHSQTVLNQMSHNADETVANKMLDNKMLPSYALSNIAGKHHEELFHKIINHPNIDETGLLSLAHHADGDQIDHIIAHKHTNDHIMGAIAQYRHPSDKQMHDMIDDPMAGSMTMKNIAKNGNDEHRDKILDHPRLAPVTMDMLAYHGNDSHREKLLNHPDIQLGATLSTIMSGSRNGYDHIATDEHREKAKQLKS